MGKMKLNGLDLTFTDMKTKENLLRQLKELDEQEMADRPRRIDKVAFQLGRWIVFAAAGWAAAWLFCITWKWIMLPFLTECARFVGNL